MEGFLGLKWVFGLEKVKEAASGPMECSFLGLFFFFSWVGTWGGESGMCSIFFLGVYVLAFAEFMV